MNLTESIRNDLNKIDLNEADNIATKNFKAPYEVSAKVAKVLILAGNDTVQWVVGDLDLSGAQITRLPHNMGIDGSLNISGTNITELPNDFHVHGNLDISNTPIRELGGTGELTVGGYINANNSRVSEIGDEVYIGWIEGESNGSSKNDLHLENTPIRSIPEISIADLFIKGTSLQDSDINSDYIDNIYRD
jgi:hypothetical protein